jgi:hypothetical protein
MCHVMCYVKHCAQVIKIVPVLVIGSFSNEYAMYMLFVLM